MTQRVVQTQFNKLVFETMREFNMEFMEAIEFSIAQLDSQGVVTSMLLRDSDIIRGEDPITQFSINYCDLEEGELFDVTQLTDYINCISALVSSDIKMKIFAGQKKIHNLLIAICKIHPGGGQDVLKLTLTCLNNLISGYPDLINKEIMDYLIELYKKSDEVFKPIIRSLFSESIKQYEQNKALFYPHAFTIIKSCLNDINSIDYLVGCDIIYSLCCNDDARDQVSDSYTRARSMADQFLLQLYQGLKMKHNCDRTGAMLQAVAAMVVCNELVGVLYKEDPTFLIINSIMDGFRSHQVILLQVTKLMASLGRNEECRNGMTSLIPLIVRTMDENIGYPDLQKTLFRATCHIALRNCKNANAFVELHAVRKIVQGMKTHNNVMLRKWGLMALRSLTSSNQPKVFLDAGVDEFVASLMTPDSELTQQCRGVLIALCAQRNRSCASRETDQWGEMKTSS